MIGAVFTSNQYCAHWGTITFEISDDNTHFTPLTVWHNASSWQDNIDEEFSAYFEGLGRYLRVSADISLEWSRPKHTTLTTLKVLTYDNTKWKPLSGYPQWQESASYYEGDLVTYNGDIYKCLVNNRDATFNTTKRENMTSSGGINSWLTNTQYRTDDIVIYQDKIYRCIIAHASSSFSSDRNNWVEISPTSLQNWQASITYPVDSLVLYDNSTGIQHWAGNTSYTVNDKVVYDDRIYECSVANSDSDFTVSNWHQIATAQVNIYKCITENNDADFTSSQWLAISSIGFASIEDIEAMI